MSLEILVHVNDFVFRDGLYSMLRHIIGRRCGTMVLSTLRKLPAPPFVVALAAARRSEQGFTVHLEDADPETMDIILSVLHNQSWRWTDLTPKQLFSVAQESQQNKFGLALQASGFQWVVNRGELESIEEDEVVRSAARILGIKEYPRKESTEVQRTLLPRFKEAREECSTTRSSEQVESRF